jgi:hypothetical protein
MHENIKPENNGHPWDPQKVSIVQNMVKGLVQIFFFLAGLAI